MLNHLCYEAIGETPEAHIAKFRNNYAATDWLWKKLLTSSSFMALITTFVHQKTGAPIAEKKTVFAEASNRNPWRPWKYVAILSKICQANRTREVSNATVEGPLDVDRKTATQSTKTATLNDVRTRLNRRK